LKDALKENSDGLCKKMHDATPRAKFSSVRQKKKFRLEGHTRDTKGLRQG